MPRKDQEYQTIINKLQAENDSLKAENQDLKSKLDETKAVIAFIRTIFTEGQMRKMKGPGQVEWNGKDISNAIRLHASGPKAYTYLYRKGFPLPNASALEHWCRKFNVTKGFLTSSLSFIKHCTELKSADKICVLSFDEMKVAAPNSNDSMGEFITMPAKSVQVVMAQGLWKSWKRPVFFDFDCHMKKDLLYSIIEQLNQAGFPVVAMVCDMGPNNRQLWKDLGVTKDRPWFANPANPNEKVFTFVDAPHLLELIRYHYLDTGLIWKNELLTSSTIADLIKHSSNSNTAIKFKLTEEHLWVKNKSGQWLAAQLFSNTTVNALRHCDSVGVKVNKSNETSYFIQLVKEWFDVLNSAINTFSSPGKEPFGTALADQQRTLMHMNNFMSSPIIPNKTSLEYFQEGVIITNTALEMLYDYVKQKFNMNYIITNRLNQNVLKHVFGAIRNKAGSAGDHPTPNEFKYRLRKYILARNMEHLHGTENVESDTTDCLSSRNSLDIRKYLQKHNVRDEFGPNREQKALHQIVADRDPELLDELDTASFDVVNILEEGAVAEYLSEYTASEQI